MTVKVFTSATSGMTVVSKVVGPKMAALVPTPYYYGYGKVAYGGYMLGHGNTLLPIRV